MLLSFKTLLNYNFFLFFFTPDNCVLCQAAFVGHNSNFCQTLSDVGANIQAWSVSKWNKFELLKELINNNIRILMTSETKIVETFPDSKFCIDGY